MCLGFLEFGIIFHRRYRSFHQRVRFEIENAVIQPSLENLKRVLDFLEGKNLGYKVILDASVRYDFGRIASLPACFKEDIRKGKG